MSVITHRSDAKGAKKLHNRHEHHSMLVIGIGNTYRFDDAVGLHIAQHIRKISLVHVAVIEQSGDGAAVMESWKDANTVILIDAVSSGGKPGTIYQFDAHKQSIPAEFFHYSTHAFGVAEAIELARALRQLPPHLIVYGIEGKSFEAGVGLSPDVEKAAQEVVERIKQDMKDNSSQNSIEIKKSLNNP